MKFSIAIVGCGGVSSMHLDGCARHPDRVQIVAACDPDAARVAQAQAKYGIAQGFTSVQEMIEGAHWDAAIVCTPTNVREPIVRVLAAAGKHVFVEKPLASSLQEGTRLMEICEASGVLLAVDQNFRYHFPFHIAKKQIAEGLLGHITAIHHQHLCFRQDQGWRIHESRHTLEIMGVHWLDGFRWILNDDAQTVAAQTVAAQMRHAPSIDCAGETDLSVQVAFENGTVASYVDSFSSLFTRCETLILGECGTLRLEYGGAAFYDRNGGTQPAQKWDNPFGGDNKPDSAFECLNNLLRAIESGTQPDNSGRDNLKTLALMEAAYQSAESSSVITLRGDAL